jgi:hypothetical protein
LGRTVAGLLRPGAAARGGYLGYFGGSHIAGPLITVALWAVLRAVLVVLRSRPGRQPNPTDRHRSG